MFLSPCRLLLHFEREINVSRYLVIVLFIAITGWETNNHYTVENARGQRVFYALEESSWCTRWCCGALRSFDMSISDNYQNEVIHLKRAFRCNSCWCPCCLQVRFYFSISIVVFVRSSYWEYFNNVMYFNRRN